MKKWFFNLKNGTKIAIIIIFWIITIAASFYVASDSFDTEKSSSIFIAIAYLLLFAFTITLTVWKSDSHKYKQKQSKIYSLCAKKKKEVFKNFISRKGTIITIIFCLLCIIVFSAIFTYTSGWLIGLIVLSIFMLSAILSIAIIYPCISRSKAISYVIDGIEVGAFFVKEIGIKERSFDLYLVIGDEITSQRVNVRRIDKILYDDDTFSQIFNLICDIEDSYYIQKETKSKEAFITIKSSLNGKNITLITNKYTRKLKLFINGESITNYISKNSSKEKEV